MGSPSGEGHRVSLRVLHVNDQKSFGGGENQTLRLIFALEILGVKNHLLGHARGVLRERLTGSNCTFHPLPPGPPALILPLSTYFLRQSQTFDLLHAHSGRSARAMSGCGALPVVIHRRIPDRSSTSGLARMKKADGVLCVSSAIRQGLLNWGLHPDRVHTIYSSVDTAALNPASLDLPGSPCLGFLGHFRRHKGLDLLLQALPGILPEFPDLHLHLVGEGKEEPNLRALSTSLNLDGHVHFHAFQSRPADWLNALDLFVMPSREEGLGSVALQAQYLKVPVLATRVGGIPEGVAHGITGHLVEPNDSGALEKGLRAVLHDHDQMKRFAEAGPSRICDHFSVEMMAQKTKAIYEQILQGHTGEK
jgi:glycosyltransferase involved in cell wall biosynthesis